jgi:HD-GYP domain-containing protein (c-di-GMP phosphodiesterase class II)
MFKRIDPADVVLGMFIHKLEGNWFQHPFWRARFLLTDPDQLELLRESSVPAVIIDTSRGVDLVEEVQPAPPPPPRPAPSPAAPLRQRMAVAPRAASPVVQHTLAPRVLAAPPARVGRSFGRASAVADRARKTFTEALLEVRLGKSLEPGRVAPVVDSIIRSIQTNPFAFNGLMRLQADNQTVYQHALATSALMVGLGKTLQLDPIGLHAAGLAGLLLDVGVALLLMEHPEVDGDLTKLPGYMLQRHVALGQEFIANSGFAENIKTACLEHHERFDGTGWPHGTGGAALSKLGRMAAICDHFDLVSNVAIGTSRVDPGETLRRMKADSGAFDPDMLKAFEISIGQWPIGSVVELRSGRLGVVIDQNSEAIHKPLLAVFFNPADGRRIDDLWIDLNCCYGADAIVGSASIDALPEDLQARARAALMATINRVTGGGRSGGVSSKVA